MTFVPGQVLTAAELNVLDITSLTVDTDTLVVDATNDRVGINQASPSVALDVGGSVVIDDDLTVDTNTLKVDSTNNRVGILKTSPTVTLHVGGGAIIDDDLDVIQNLTVTGSATISPNLTVTGVVTPGQIDAFDNTNAPTSSTAKYLFGRSSSQAIALHGGSGGNYITSISQTSNAKSLRVRVSEDDNATGYEYTFSRNGLHIGSGSATTYPLQVNGNAWFNNGSQLLRNWGGGSDIDALLPGSGFGGVMDCNVSGHFVIGIRNNDTADSFSIVSGGTNSQGYTANNTYDLLVANFRADGKVGIGTTSQSQKLQVNDGMFYSSRSGFNPTANENAGLKVDGNYGGGIIFAEGSARTKVYAGGGNQFQVRVGATATTGGTLGLDMASNGEFRLRGSFPGVSGYLTVRRRSSDGLLGYASSSQRYKENIVDADDTWRQIYNLRPRDFDWRESFFGDDPDNVPSDRSDFGLIAEEANEVMPSIVQWTTPPPPDPDDEATEEGEPFVPVIEAVDYEKLSTYLLPAIQDLNARVATLESA